MNIYQITRLGVDKVKPEVWFGYLLLIDWHFNNGPKRKIDDVLLEHVVLPHVLSLTVHLDLEHLPNSQGFLVLLSEPCTPTQTL